MRYSLFAIVFLITSSVTFTQILPVDFNSNILAQSQGLTGGLALFSCDTASEILFNPARGAQYQKQFIYINYPGGSSSISGASVFRTNSGWWLIQLSHNLSATSSTNLGYQGAYNTSSFDSVVTNSNNSNNTLNSQTTAKISFIGGSDNYNYSYGIFAIVQPSSSKGSLTSRSVSYADSAHEIDMNVANNSQENSLYVLGLEYTLSGRGYDFVSRMSVQKSYTSYNETPNQTTSNSYDSTYERRYGITNNTLTKYSSSDSPLSLFLTAYYQQKVTWLTMGDYLFLSLKGFVSDDKVSINRNQYQYYQYDYFGSYSIDDTTTQFANGSVKPTMWGVGLSLGYVITEHLSDIDWFVGVNPGASYNKYPLSPGLNLTETPYSSDFNSLTLTVNAPFYVKYSPTNWFSVFGGIIYNYIYSYSKTEYHGIPVTSNFSSGYYTVNFPGSSTSSSLYSSTTTFLGVDLTHPSGFNVQIKFNNTIATNTAWFISAGFPL